MAVTGAARMNHPLYGYTEAEIEAWRKVNKFTPHIMADRHSEFQVPLNKQAALIMARQNDPEFKQAWDSRPRKSFGDRLSGMASGFADAAGNFVEGVGPLAAVAYGGHLATNALAGTGAVTGGSGAVTSPVTTEALSASTPLTGTEWLPGGGGQAALNGTLPGGSAVAGGGFGIPNLNIPGTEQTLWPAILGGVTQGLIADNAISDAAEISAEAATYAADLQQGQYDQTRADLSPYMDAGTNALAQYTGYGRSRVNPDDYYGNVELDPGYQFRKNEMLTGTRNELAGFGEFMSGSRINAIMDRTGKMASDEYGRAYGRVDNEYRLARNEEDTYLNRLAGLVQGGHNAAAGVGNIGMQTANNIGNLTMDAANSQGALELGQSNILNNIIGDVTDTYYLRDNPYDPFQRYYKR